MSHEPSGRSLLRSRAPSHDAVGLLLECHERIRAFLSLGRQIAEVREASAAALEEAALRVLRYFSEALPLHARDEEESILPRLHGHDPAVDAALDAMVREHAEHEPPLRRLLDACRELVRDPLRHAALRHAVADAVEELERHFAEHLRREEEVVFPAMRRYLDAAANAAIVAEIRGRRGVTLPAAPPTQPAGR